MLKDELDGEPEAEEEDSIIAQIQVMRSQPKMFPSWLMQCSPQEILDDNDEIFRAQDRRQRDRIFQAINHGKLEFETDFGDSPARTFFFISACSFLVLIHMYVT
jgi:hypothetical protein